MRSSTVIAIVTQTLFLGTDAQNITGDSNNATGACSDVDNLVQYNASTTRLIPALQLSGPRPTAISEKFYLERDYSQFWELSLRVRKQPSEDNATTARPDSGLYQQAMFLDTKVSNMTNIGSCHQTIQAESDTSMFQWTREAVNRGLKDDGDCMTLLGAKCVEALKQKAKENAALFPLRNGRCDDMDSSLPPGCLGVGPHFQDRQMNLTYLDGLTEGYRNSQFDSSLGCNKVNVSSTHILPVAERMDYDAAVRFPVIDVITFWPNRSNGMQAYDTRWPDNVHVEVVCMRPDANITEGSATPPRGSDMLARSNVAFSVSSGASALDLGYGLFGIISAVVMGIMVVF